MIVHNFGRSGIDTPPYRVMVAGSRAFADYGLLAATLDRLLAGKENVVIVSGGAKARTNSASGTRGSAASRSSSTGPTGSGTGAARAWSATG